MFKDGNNNTTNKFKSESKLDENDDMISSIE